MAEADDRGDAHRRQLYSGFGHTMARAVEMVAVPLLCGIAGRYLDGLLHTTPALTVVLLTLGVASAAARAFYEYATSMDAFDHQAPWRREPR